MSTPSQDVPRWFGKSADRDSDCVQVKVARGVVPGKHLLRIQAEITGVSPVIQEMTLLVQKPPTPTIVLLVEKPLSLTAGNSGEVTVRARRGHAPGQITIRVSGLGKGLAAAPLVLGANQEAGKLKVPAERPSQRFAGLAIFWLERWSIGRSVA